ncbi:hypothetical protein CK203_115774 [Vitis vinifera]|uniref:Uncharacterized protein n=1 Tax=Vitis vinifera TaxID=29760 RepID=A0A438EZG7_VITVI|nr:hypothetical protein CK203_115774 [Vitis vinifera]
MANKTIGGCVWTPCPDALFAGIRLNQEPILVEVAHPSIWQLRGSSGMRGINIGAGRDDDREWRKTIERRQLASERQLKALLQETERLKEENAVLRIQASTSGPPRRQRSRGQVANSRTEPESIYPGSAGAIPGACNRKDNVIKNPVVKFDARKTRPTKPGRSRPPVATTWAPRPDPMVAPMVQNVHPHRDPMVTPAMRNVHSHLAEQPTGETSQTSHPSAPSAKAG